GISDGAERRRSGAASRGAGEALRRRDSGAAGSYGSAGGRAISIYEAGGWHGAFLPRADDRDRRAVASAGGSGNRPAAGRGGLLRRRLDGGAFLPGRNRLRDRRGEFGGPGGDEFREICGAG